MKRHQAMAASICPGSQGDSPESLATQNTAARTPTESERHLELTAGAPRVRPIVPRQVGARRPRAAHTLLVSGSLDRSSTHLLEAEIERLYESGIREITLDLTQLAGIDFAGVAVIAFRRKWCRRHGCELGLVRATQDMRRAFEAAGVGELLRDESAGDAPADASDAARELAEARLERPDPRIIAAATPPAAGGARIVARRADEPACGEATTPMEEADAATV
jgi:anti-anti-sigma factor